MKIMRQNNNLQINSHSEPQQKNNSTMKKINISMFGGLILFFVIMSVLKTIQNLIEVLDYLLPIRCNKPLHPQKRAMTNEQAWSKEERVNLAFARVESES